LGIFGWIVFVLSLALSLPLLLMLLLLLLLLLLLPHVDRQSYFGGERERLLARGIFNSDGVMHALPSREILWG